MPDTYFEFHETVAKVEERFRAVYDPGKVGAAKSQSQMDEGTEQVSTGWWVVLARFGVAVRFGATRPDIAAGDTLVMVPRIIKKPSAPDLAVVPPAPPPIDAAAARTVWLESLPPEVRAKIEELA